MNNAVPIRSISRCGSILVMMSRNGPLTLTQISQMTDIPYASILRIVQTLLIEGVVNRERRRYELAPLAEALHKSSKMGTWTRSGLDS